jgi:hypothetical protein
MNYISGVMVSVIVASTVDGGFEPWSGQTKDYKIDICCIFAKHSLRREQRQVVSNSRSCIRVKRHFYPQTVVSLRFDFWGNFLLCISSKNETEQKISLDVESQQDYPLSGWKAKVWSWTIVGNVFEECHAPCMLKTSFEDFEKE